MLQNLLSPFRRSHQKTLVLVIAAMAEVAQATSLAVAAHLSIAETCNGAARWHDSTGSYGPGMFSPARPSIWLGSCFTWMVRCTSAWSGCELQGRRNRDGYHPMWPILCPIS